MQRELDVFNCARCGLPHGYEATAVNEIDGQVINAKVFPNPAVNNITIETNFDQAGEFTLEMSNVSGQIVLKRNNIVISEGRTETDVNVEELPSGIYMVTLIGDDVKVSFKIIKQL